MTIQHRGSVRLVVRVGLVVLLALALSECSSGKGKVTGKVTYKGETVPAGTVAFYGKGDAVSSAPISPDGTYTATSVPLGEVKVTVSTPPPVTAADLEKAKKNPM